MRDRRAVARYAGLTVNPVAVPPMGELCRSPDGKTSWSYDFGSM
jgi:hypothetical protein